MLYRPEQGRCGVVILHEGERVNLPVDPEDDCFFENTFVAISVEGKGTSDMTKTKKAFKPADEIKQVRFWVEDEEGNPTDGNGIVKMEYPEGFFNEREPDHNQ